MPRNKPEDIWKNVSDYGDSTKCWEWLGATARGYGEISIHYHMHKTHRIAYELIKGPITDGLFVCHSCDNKLCCNPDHLWLGTTEDNMRDMVVKGRSARNCGEKSGSVKLSKEQIISVFNFRNEGYSQRCIASIYGVSNQQISRILSRKRWGHLMVPQLINKFSSVRRGESHPNTKILDSQLLEIFELYENGLSQRWIANKFGVSHAHIRRILGGSRKGGSVQFRHTTKS